MNGLTYLTKFSSKHNVTLSRHSPSEWSHGRLIMAFIRWVQWYAVSTCLAGQDFVNNKSKFFWYFFQDIVKILSITNQNSVGYFFQDIVNILSITNLGSEDFASDKANQHVTFE